VSQYLELAWTSGLDGLWLCLKILILLSPLMVIYEVAREYGIFERPWPGVDALMSRLGLGQGAFIPLLAGTFLGLIYGAGILIAMSKQQSLSNSERLALVVFLATCHAVIEDTAIFALLGGSIPGMLIPRVLLAVIITALLARGLRGRA
jgi:hypothetical protein